ncbi:MAG: hypothetical protein QOG97_1941 [Acidimicrobiaceae bacterium]|jgi:hypothetical protein|nr:hypothetical protein [Acidimicrobiaceae bacterium]
MIDINARYQEANRFHDILQIAHAAVLGRSPAFARAGDARNR